MNTWESVPQIVDRAAATTPQGTAHALFTITGDNNIDEIVGEVTVEIGAGANNMKLVCNPTVGADVDMCATVDIDGATVGTKFHITGTQANAMIATASGSFETQPQPLSLPAGTIDLDCDGSTAGSIEWKVIYRTKESSGSVVSA